MNVSCGGLALAVTDHAAIAVQAGACSVVVIALDISTRGQDSKWISRADHCTRSRDALAVKSRDKDHIFLQVFLMEEIIQCFDD